MRYSAIGDIALLLPLLRAMPEKPVIITSPLGRALLEDEFDDFVVLRSKKLRDVLAHIAEIRRRRFDVLLDQQNNDRSRLIRTFAGARRMYCHRSKLLEIPAFERAKILFEKSSLLGTLDDRFVAKPKNYIVLNAGSSPRWISKRLPDAKWREIAGVLRERFGLPLVLTGSADEAEYIAHIASVIGAPVENRVGKTSLVELKHLLGGAFLTVTTDSAAMHISAAMKTPTIGVFGASTWKSMPFGPWNAALFDHTVYPDGQPPVPTQVCGNYYDHVDIREGLDRLKDFLECGGLPLLSHGPA
jgi:ADP-heptose:LPS heptosyltransferase